MSRLLRTLAGLALSAAALAARADVEVEGFKFPDTETVAGQNLLLNGAGMDTIGAFKALAVGFYLVHKETTMEAACAEKGAKRIQFYMLREVSARDMSNALLDRIRQNVPKEEFAANIIQTAQLGEIFGTRPKVVKGDLINIDYNPQTQITEFFLNGQKLGSDIKGESFMSMMMKVWIGPKARAATRRQLLGGHD
jgi:hypothetical protein